MVFPVQQNKLIILGALAIIFTVNACSPVKTVDMKEFQPSINAVGCSDTASEKKLFCVSLASKVSPVPINKIHSWVLHLEDDQGAPVEHANILVYGGMPSHKHGFPTNPQVTEDLGQGNYLIEGVKFSMHGNWEVWLSISTSNGNDKAVFKIKVS